MPRGENIADQAQLLRVDILKTSSIEKSTNSKDAIVQANRTRKVLESAKGIKAESMVFKITAGKKHKNITNP